MGEAFKFALVVGRKRTYFNVAVIEELRTTDNRPHPSLPPSPGEGAGVAGI
jgi:hypothetical protein